MIGAGGLPLVARVALLSATLCSGIGVITHGAPVFAQDSIAVAPDLPADAESKLAISNMVRQGVMHLRATGNFSPSEPSTLGEYLISLQQLFQLTPPSNPPHFTDVPPRSPYFAAAQATAPYLNRQAMCMGCALSTNLYPDQPLTRAQSSVALVSILNARGALPLVDDATANQALKDVEDARRLSPLARRLVATGISGSIVSLSATHKADLSSIETRASTAAILNRAQTKFQLPEVH
jgi:hypothetical protein